MRADQLDPAPLQTLPQRIAVIRLIGNHPQRLLPGSARVMTPPYADRRERRLASWTSAGEAE